MDADTAMMNYPIVITNGKIGRPDKYFTHVEPRLNELEKWVKKGVTDYCIADNLHVTHESLIEYKKKYIPLIETYKRARAADVAEIVHSVRQKAHGHTATINKQKVLQNGVVVDFTEEQYIPSDTNAAIFYLTNKAPDEWKQKGNEVVVIQQNYQIDDLRAKLLQALQTGKSPELLEAVDVEVVEIT